jgi:hypothetical protein
MFFYTLEALVLKSPNGCPLIIWRDFNNDILNDSNHKNNKQQLIDFLNRFKLKSQFKNNTTNVESQLDHKWTHTLENECKSNVSKAY